LVVLRLQAGPFQFGANQKSDGRHQAYFIFSVVLRIPVLQIDYAHQLAF
jgi:hypothetical protein